MYPGRSQARHPAYASERNADSRIAIKWQMMSQHFIQDDTQRVNISLAVSLSPAAVQVRDSVLSQGWIPVS